MYWVAMLAAALGISGDCVHGSVHTFPTGLADAENAVAYLQSEAGNIDALDLHGGKRIWESTERVKPLGLFESFLITAAPAAKRNELAIVLLDKKRGVATKTLTASFPETVNTAELTFAYTTAAVDGKLQLAWSYVPSNRGGAARRVDAGVPISRASGLKEIDLHSGHARDIDHQGTEPETKINSPSFPVRQDSKSTFDPWDVGDSVVHLSIQTLPAEKRVVLRTLDWSGRTETRVLLSGHNPSAYKSGDGCYVFVLENAPSQSQPWHVFSVMNGRSVGEIRFEPGSDQPEVIGSTAFWILAKHTEPNTETHILEAADLVTGKPLWSYVLGTVPYDRGAKRLE